MAGKRLIVKTDRASVTFDGPLAAGLLADLEQAVGREVIDVVGAISEEYRADAEETWPVRTGKSRAALRSDVRLSGHDVVDGVVSTVEYGRYIVSSKVGTKNKLRPRSPLTELRKAVIAGKQVDTERIKAALVEGLRRAGG